NVVGTLSQYFSNGAPPCGASGAITLQLTAGSHMIGGDGGGLVWNNTSVNLNPGECVPFRFITTVPVASVSVSLGYSTLTPGRTSLATAVAYDASGRAINRPISWSSSSPAIAKVEG